MSPSQSSFSHRHSPMGHIHLELSPKNFHAISLDPEPDWTLDDLKAELKDIEAKYSTEVLPENKCPLQSGAIFSCKDLSVVSDFGRNGKPFVMSAFDDDDDDSDEDADVEDEDGEVSKCSNHSLQLETNLTSDTGAVNEELDREVAANELMSGTGVVEGSLFELERERTLRVQEEIRERMLSFEEDLKAERERSSTALLLVDKERKEKQEMARRVDKQYQRKIAEARDSHLSAVQRDHQQRSQIEERRIRKEAAVEEAKKREREAREIKEREEKLRAEAEAHVKAAQAAERKAAAEAEKMAAAEAQRKTAAETEKKAAAEAERKAKEEEARSLQSQQNVPTGVKAKVAESAAKLEGERIGKLIALQEQCQPLRSDPNLSKELKTYERQIGVRLRQVTGTQEQVRVKATELIRLVNDPRLPNSFCLMVFAAKAVSQCDTQTLDLNSIVFALAHVIVLVTSQVPAAMDLILAEFHKSCIFTVPKYIPYLKNAFESENAYYKEVGYREDNGKVESTDNYLSRMKAYVALYAAIIQTDIPGIQNLHGVREGWAWLARFLNALPPNRFTGAVLEAFLKIAGFRLYQAYPKPFTKIINLISRDFLVKLKSQNDPDSNRVINNIETYLITQQYRKEPEGHTLAFTDESKSLRA